VLPYLALESPFGLDVNLEVERNGQVISRPPCAAMYWSPAQMLAHLAVSGALSTPVARSPPEPFPGPAKGQRGRSLNSPGAAPGGYSSTAGHGPS
jgi:fumarylacetoacetase